MIEFIPYRKSKERSKVDKHNENNSMPEFRSPYNVRAINVYNRSVLRASARKNIVFDANLTKKK